MIVRYSGMEFLSLTGEYGCYRPLGKFDRLCSKKKSFQLSNNRFLTCFRGGLILSLSVTVTVDVHATGSH